MQRCRYNVTHASIFTITRRKRTGKRKRINQGLTKTKANNQHGVVSMDFYTENVRKRHLGVFASLPTIQKQIFIV
ncbi:hypothetical protein OIU77_029464 [Salix suchowensis]|uniref:Uncharacterized protein n=1 Tax=Salix suchowensis TaxID=1278906 RepID=A0ABQ9B8N4_9ROSI|nr:hypothetical protein OIU77_029464 [Salix suchowensis]